MGMALQTKIFLGGFSCDVTKMLHAISFDRQVSLISFNKYLLKESFLDIWLADQVNIDSYLERLQ